jgi:hypothetical protein
LLLGATDRTIGLVDRFAACFIDRRDPRLVEHLVRTLVGQRVFGIALGYEDINDHDELRHDPMMAVLAGAASGSSSASISSSHPALSASLLSARAQALFCSTVMRSNLTQGTRSIFNSFAAVARSAEFM